MTERPDLDAFRAKAESARLCSATMAGMLLRAVDYAEATERRLAELEQRETILRGQRNEYIDGTSDYYLRRNRAVRWAWHFRREARAYTKGFIEQCQATEVMRGRWAKAQGKLDRRRATPAEEIRP